MPKKFSSKDNADIHKDLKGFEIKINALGEIESNFSIEKLNDFLNETDKKEKKKK